MNGNVIPQPPTPSPGSYGPDPLFNPLVHTQGEMPHLVELLVAEYREHIRRHNGQLPVGQAPLDAEKTIRLARPLLNFFEAYLNTYRPVQAFPVDMNYGLVLSNSQRCAVSPGTAQLQGTMQNSGSIGVTQGVSNPGQDGVVQVNDALPTLR